MAPSCKILGLGLALVLSGAKIHAAGAFVTVCGTKLCILGCPWQVHGGTIYHMYSKLPQAVALAQDGGLNLLHIIAYQSCVSSTQCSYDEAAWRRADQAIAAAGAAGMHALLDLSDYAHSLKGEGKCAATQDWGAYLSFVANRVNTVSGATYKNDPTIAMLALYGEADAPRGGDPLRSTTQQLTDFYKRTMAQWKALAPNILVQPGGLTYLDWNGGIDWRAIFSDPNCAMGSLHIGSEGDFNITVPAVSAYLAGIGKPLLNEAWSSCTALFPSDAAKAVNAQRIYDMMATYPMVGDIFWNLGDEGPGTSTCDLNKGFPLTWAVVKANAPKPSCPSPTASPSPTPCATATPHPPLSVTPAQSPALSPASSFTTTFTPAPRPSMSGGAGIQGLAAYPNPNPLAFHFRLGEKVEGLELRLYSAGMTCLFESKLGAMGPGQASVALDASVLGRLAGGAYFARLSAPGSRGQALAKFIVLR